MEHNIEEEPIILDEAERKKVLEHYECDGQMDIDDLFAFKIENHTNASDNLIKTTITSALNEIGVDVVEFDNINISEKPAVKKVKRKRKIH